jgi:lysophospholipase L1-like esterase
MNRTGMNFPISRKVIIRLLARERGDLIIILKGANDAFRQFFKEKMEEDK